ncbi:ribonuclease BN [Streptacidiphilus sp. EB129]|uniref:ribonuclease BN n=1 Tax=Streptacidiphilus sp. EB129 TaxID=3156262 RepID=UPI003513DCDA
MSSSAPGDAGDAGDAGEPGEPGRSGGEPDPGSGAPEEPDGASGTRPPGRSARARAAFESTRLEAERRFPVLTELTSRLLTANLLDAATRLAAQAFLTTVPLLFAIAAFAPPAVRNQLHDSLRSVFALDGAGDAQLTQVLEANDGAAQLRETSGIVGLLMALISATSFSRAMARVCSRAWLLPKAPARAAAWRWLVWVLVLLVLLVCQGPLRDGFGAGLWLGVPLTFLAEVCGAWWTQHLLLASRVAWLPLLPGALLVAGTLASLSLTARFYLPAAMNRAISDYGSLGLVLTLLSWLIAICAAVTFAVTIGAVLAQEPPVNGLVRYHPPPRPADPPAGQPTG